MGLSSKAVLRSPDVREAETSHARLEGKAKDGERDGTASRLHDGVSEPAGVYVHGRVPSGRGRLPAETLAPQHPTAHADPLPASALSLQGSLSLHFVRMMRRLVALGFWQIDKKPEAMLLNRKRCTGRTWRAIR